MIAALPITPPLTLDRSPAILHGPAMSAISLLRARTRAAHDVVDAAFGAFGLQSASEYRRFLAAHARALSVCEPIAARVWPDLRPRLPLIAQDLLALGTPFGPVGLPADPPADEAAAWGALYVVEGSRLGGGMLAQRVAADLPRAYLSAVHRPGEWRAIRAAIDVAGEGRDATWHTALVDGAMAVFARYEAAAQEA